MTEATNSYIDQEGKSPQKPKQLEAMQQAVTPLKVALYARVSTDEQKEGQTIDAQVAEIERFTGSRGWVIGEVYKDEGWSGALIARPELDRLRDDARRGLFAAVVINDVDRLARDVTHLGIIKRDLERAGVKVVFRKIPAENSPTHNLLVNVLGSFAEFEREMIIDRLRRGRRHKVESKREYVGSLPPYGYRYIRRGVDGSTSGRLEREPNEATVVQQVYRWVDAEGLSVHAVVRRLRQLGLLGRKGGPWQRSSVMRILRCETYAGVWHYNKREACLPRDSEKRGRYVRDLKSSRRWRPTADWVPLELPEALRLVHRDQWQRVQNRITQNRVFSRRNAKHNYLLRGLVRCGACGASYVGDPHGKYFTYRCTARCRSGRAIRDEVVDGVVWTAVREVLLNPQALAQHTERIRAASATAAEAQTQSARTALAALEAARTEESRLLHAYRLGAISADQLARELHPVTTRITALEKEAKEQPAVSDEPAAEAIDATDFKLVQDVTHRLDELNHDERQRLIRILVSEIRFDGTHVTIRGVAPAATASAQDEQEPTTTAEDRGAVLDAEAKDGNSPRFADDFDDGIASTLSAKDGHNPRFRDDFGDGVASTLSTKDEHNHVRSDAAPLVRRFQMIRAVPGREYAGHQKV